MKQKEQENQKIAQNTRMLLKLCSIAAMLDHLDIYMIFGRVDFR